MAHISSIEVHFWGVKSSGCENSHAIEVKCSNIPLKSNISYRKRSEMNVKIVEIQSFPATIPISQQKRLLIKVLLQYRLAWFIQKFLCISKAAGTVSGSSFDALKASKRFRTIGFTLRVKRAIQSFRRLFDD
jgi:hypothetical protein